MDNSRIKLLRKSNKLSQAGLGQLIGVSASTIGMYEQNRREPDTQTLLKLARTFDVSVDYLINATDIVGRFDVDQLARSVAQNLMDTKELMFSTDCYTQEELDGISAVIESTLKKELEKQLESKK